jgi:glucose dehydrogenase
VFFANQDDVNCAISLDGVSVGQYKATGGASGAESQSVLGYQNTTLEDVAHTLTITTNNNAASDDSVINFDAIIYSCVARPFFRSCTADLFA